jgi:hypothetical protein
MMEDRMSDVDQARCQYKSIVEAVRKYEEDDVWDECPPSVQVRSDWGDPGAELPPAEYEILLCTGGPAVRIIGDLDNCYHPMSARLQSQDWFEPWRDYHQADADIVLRYARGFFFG